MVFASPCQATFSYFVDCAGVVRGALEFGYVPLLILLSLTTARVQDNVPPETACSTAWPKAIGGLMARTDRRDARTQKRYQSLQRPDPPGECTHRSALEDCRLRFAAH